MSGPGAARLRAPARGGRAADAMVGDPVAAAVLALALGRGAGARAAVDRAAAAVGLKAARARGARRRVRLAVEGLRSERARVLLRVPERLHEILGAAVRAVAHLRGGVGHAVA